MDSAPPTIYNLTLREKQLEYDDIWSFRFEPQTPILFSPGQYVHLKVLDPAVEKSVRHMSLASSPSDPLLQFTMHMRKSSPFKRSLMALELGGEAALFKVKGEFTLPQGSLRSVVMIANGVGITPYRAMLRHLSAEGQDVPIRLIHIDRGPHLFYWELHSLPGVQLRVDPAQLEEQLQRAVIEDPSALYFAAGSTGFVHSVHARLLELGIGAESIRLDDFKAYDELDEIFTNSGPVAVRSL